MDTPVQSVIQNKLLNITVGGISAGGAILGNYMFSGVNGTAYSNVVLRVRYCCYWMLWSCFHPPPLFSTCSYMGIIVFTLHSATICGGGVYVQNPYDSSVTVTSYFLSIPFLEGVLTDQHFGRRVLCGVVK